MSWFTNVTVTGVGASGTFTTLHRCSSVGVSGCSGNSDNYVASFVAIRRDTGVSWRALRLGRLRAVSGQQSKGQESGQGHDRQGHWHWPELFYILCSHLTTFSS